MKIEVKNIKKSFAGNEVLHGISFSVESGRALGLLGRNGAGKTTTIRIFMDVFKANEGEILVDGQPFNPSDFIIGYLPEERGLYPKKKVSEQLIYLATLRGLSKEEASKNTKYWLEKIGIGDYYNRKLETLSKGNQQKVQLAQTLIASPEIVILDEPFSGLDPVNSQILKDVIFELIAAGKIVIFSSHQMSYVEEFCNDICIINKGNVVLSGELKEIKKDYGKNRLCLNASNYSIKELETKVINELSKFVSINQVCNETLVLDLISGVSKNDLLKAIMNTDINIEDFGDYKPGLQQIFIDKAGD